MLVKDDIVKHSKIVNGVHSPYVLWVEFSKEAFGLSCIIGSTYLPGEGTTHHNTEMLDTLYDDIEYLKNKLKLPICLIGDMNSRTGNLDDTLDFDHVMINECEINDFAEELSSINFSNENSAINKVRVNTDRTVNENGKALINMCKANNVIIVNGRTGYDRNIGEVTFKGHNGDSTIDYCIITPNIIPHIQDFQVDVLDQNLSDKHSPIVFTLKTKHSTGPINQNEITIETDIEYEQISTKWSDDKKSEFQSNFDQNKIQSLLQTLEDIETNGADQVKINNVVKEISNISIMAGINTNISKKTTKNKSPPQKTNKTKK